MQSESTNGHLHPTCETCRHWYKFPEEHQPPNETTGECKCLPPARVFVGFGVPSGNIVIGNGQPQPQPLFNSLYAVTRHDMSCGQHAPRHQPEPIETRG